MSSGSLCSLPYKTTDLFTVDYLQFTMDEYLIIFDICTKYFNEILENFKKNKSKATDPINKRVFINDIFNKIIKDIK